ncbi:MAG: hypothetical protein JNM00_03070, partial [Flavobacteriales bacterium]|nr:hypothetical protein [Flavobacteriales bacterium]
MSVLIVVSAHHGKYAKQQLEAVSYGKNLADQLQTQAIVFSLDEVPAGAPLGKAGASRVLDCRGLNKSDSMQCSDAVVNVAGQVGAEVVIMAHDDEGKMIAPRVAARLKAGLVSGVTGLPASGADFVVSKNVFSGKAIAHVKVLTNSKVLTLLPNSFAPVMNGSDVATET